MASSDDEFDDNRKSSVSFGAIDEDYAGAPSMPTNNKRELSRAKSYRDARSVKFSTLNKATGAAFVADAWIGKHRRRRTKYIMEFSGTFILNTAIARYYEGLAKDFQPLAVVATIILVVTIGAPISGAHYNPALTAGFWVAGDRVAPSALLYIVIICVSATLAHLLIYALYLPVGADAAERRSYIGGLPSYPSIGEWAQAMAGELLGTYFAIFIVLYTAMLANPPLGTFGPVMVGLGFYASIMTFSSVSGSVLNPGLAFALWVTGFLNPQNTQYWNILPYVIFEVS